MSSNNFLATSSGSSDPTNQIGESTKAVGLNGNSALSINGTNNRNVSSSNQERSSQTASGKSPAPTGQISVVNGQALPPKYIALQYTGPPLPTAGQSELRAASDQLQPQKFVTKKQKKSLVSQQIGSGISGGATSMKSSTITTGSFQSTISNSLPPMAQNFVSMSPMRGHSSAGIAIAVTTSDMKSDDQKLRVTKSIQANKLSVGSSNSSNEESKNILDQGTILGSSTQYKQYMRSYSKNTNPANSTFASNTISSSNPSSRFGRSNFIPLKDQSSLTSSGYLDKASLSTGGSSGDPALDQILKKSGATGLKNVYIRETRNQGQESNLPTHKSMGATSSASQTLAAQLAHQAAVQPFMSLKAKLQNNLTRNTIQRQFSTNSWKQGSGTMPIDFGSLNQQESMAFGTGRFLQGLKGELDSLDHEDLMLASFEPAKYSSKRNGIIASYGANTNQGIIRNYNEDRVAIILNIMKPKSKEGKVDYWPKCSFFGIYDGHGGNQCAEFLRDYLHQFIIKEENFPQNPIKAIRSGFREAEKLFLEFAENQVVDVGEIDRSGSCAIVIIIIDDICYVANVGDSRAVMSANFGQQVFALSNDHKPTDEVEMKRIVENGGRIYQNSSVIPHPNPTFKGQQQVIYGPHRVFPGRLSVSRTFGDIEAKLPKLDGNPKVVVAEPDIMAFKITEAAKFDFIILGCDGIFDKLDNKETVHLVWQSVLERIKDQQRRTASLSKGAGEESKHLDVHTQCGLSVDSLLKTTALRKACDNLTVVMIAFDHFEQFIASHSQNYSVKEEDIVETLLPPLVEANDHLNMLNDLDDLMRKAQQAANLERQRPKVLYLDNEDVIDDINLGPSSPSPPLNEPVFIEDDHFNSNSNNFEDIIQMNENERHLMTQTVKVPAHKNHLLSEISEEDDVISMVSERTGSRMRGGGPKNVVGSPSKNASQKASKQKIGGGFHYGSATQPYTGQVQNMRGEELLMSQKPANLQDGGGHAGELQSENLVLSGDIQIEKKTHTSNQKTRTGNREQMNKQFLNGGPSDNLALQLYQELAQARIKKVATPGNTGGSHPPKIRQSRNDQLVRGALSLKTQQVGDPSGFGGHFPSQIAPGQHIPIMMRPQSGSNRRASSSNGQSSQNQINANFNTLQAPIRNIQQFNQTTKLAHIISGGQQSSKFTRNDPNSIIGITNNGSNNAYPQIGGNSQFSKTQKSESLKRSIQAAQIPIGNIIIQNRQKQHQAQTYIPDSLSGQQLGQTIQLPQNYLTKFTGSSVGTASGNATNQFKMMKTSPCSQFLKPTST